MKLLKATYYRVRYKEAYFHSQYWCKKAKTTSPMDMEKWKVCVDRTIYWLIKMIEYAITMEKELES